MQGLDVRVARGDKGREVMQEECLGAEEERRVEGAIGTHSGAPEDGSWSACFLLLDRENYWLCHSHSPLLVYKFDLVMFVP